MRRRTGLSFCRHFSSGYPHIKKDCCILQQPRFIPADLLGKLSFCCFNQRCKSCCIIDCHLGEHLAVDRDIRKLQSIHKLTIRNTVHPACRINPGNPELPELPLSLLAPCEGGCQRSHDSLLCHAVLFASCAAVTLSQFQNPVMLLLSV